MRETDWGSWLVFIGIGGTVLLLAGLVVAMIVNEIKHPCLEYQSYQTTCGGGMYCMMYDTKGDCQIYGTHPEYPCTEHRCVRRQP